MIKVRGWQVSPAELESVLMLHSDILDCGVVGAKISNSFDEVPRAYIVRKSGSQLDPAAVKSFMSTYLTGYKSLNGGVVFVDSIPKNATGKILRKALKELAERDVKEQAASRRNFIHFPMSSFMESQPTSSKASRSNNTSSLNHIDAVQRNMTPGALSGIRESVEGVRSGLASVMNTVEGGFPKPFKEIPPVIVGSPAIATDESRSEGRR